MAIKVIPVTIYSNIKIRQVYWGYVVSDHLMVVFLKLSL